MEYIDGVSEVFFCSNHEECGIIGVCAAPIFSFSVCNAGDVSCVAYFYKQDFDAEDENEGADNVSLWDTLFQIDLVSEVSSH